MRTTVRYAGPVLLHSRRRVSAAERTSTPMTWKGSKIGALRSGYTSGQISGSSTVIGFSAWLRKGIAPCCCAAFVCLRTTSAGSAACRGEEDLSTIGSARNAFTASMKIRMCESHGLRPYTTPQKVARSGGPSRTGPRPYRLHQGSGDSTTGVLCGTPQAFHGVGA